MFDVTKTNEVDIFVAWLSKKLTEVYCTCVCFIAIIIFYGLSNFWYYIAIINIVIQSYVWLPQWWYYGMVYLVKLYRKFVIHIHNYVYVSMACKDTLFVNVLQLIVKTMMKYLRHTSGDGCAVYTIHMWNSLILNTFGWIMLHVSHIHSYMYTQHTGCHLK